MKELSVNGITLRYDVRGHGDPLILLHGNGEDHHLFDVEIRQLSEAGYRVYAPDSRGHGLNAPMHEYHYADMAEDIFQFIRSDGGIIGLLLELRHPDTLSRMAVSGVNLSPEGIDPDFVAEYTEINRRAPDPLITLMLTEPHIDPESLRQIRIPVLVTVGEHDLIIPEETQRIVSHLPHACQITVPGADHGSYIQGSEVMGRLLLDFFSEPTA